MGWYVRVIWWEVLRSELGWGGVCTSDMVGGAKEWVGVRYVRVIWRGVGYVRVIWRRVGMCE